MLTFRWKQLYNVAHSIQNKYNDFRWIFEIIAYKQHILFSKMNDLQTIWPAGFEQLQHIIWFRYHKCQHCHFQRLSNHNIYFFLFIHLQQNMQWAFNFSLNFFLHDETEFWFEQSAQYFYTLKPFLCAVHACNGQNVINKTSNKQFE